MAAAAADPALQQEDDDEMLTPKVRLAMNVAFVVTGVILAIWGWLGHGETGATMWIVAGCAFLSAAVFFTCDGEAAKAAADLDVESAGELRFAASNNPK